MFVILPALPTQAAEYWQMAFLAMLSITQASVVWLGLAAGMVVCVRGVVDGSLTVGDAVLFVTMMNQLYIPLTFFGSYYRQVRQLGGGGGVVQGGSNAVRGVAGCVAGSCQRAAGCSSEECKRGAVGFRFEENAQGRVAGMLLPLTRFWRSPK